jgi:hypothetical protein
MIISLCGSLGRYLLTLSIVAGLGAFALAADVYARFLASRGGRVLDAYSVVLTIAIAGGTVVLGWRSVAGRTDPAVLGLGAALGPAIGMIARRLDRMIVRHAGRRRPAQSSSSRGAVSATARSGGAMPQMRPAPTEGALLLGGTVRRQPGVHRGRNTQTQVDPREFGAATVIAAAVAEELFYRGVLLRAVLLPGPWPGALLVAATVVAFLLSHLTFGWPHVVAKAPLGVGALAAVLITGTVLTAIVAHVWFNLSALRDVRDQTAVRS